jgi:hypothetical protein
MNNEGHTAGYGFVGNVGFVCSDICVLLSPTISKFVMYKTAVVTS